MKSMNGETTLSTVNRIQRSTRALRQSDHTAIDWELVRQQLDLSMRKLGAGNEVTQEELDQVWGRRTAQVASDIVEEDTGEQIELVMIRLGQEAYALDVQYVYEIRPAALITRVPRVPEWVAGVVNLRGQVLSVLDLLRFLGLQPTEPQDMGSTRQLIVAQTDDMELALLVDDVLAVETIPVSKIRDGTGVVRGIRPDYVRGVLVKGSENEENLVTKNNHDHHLLVILDLPVLLADKQLIIHEEIL